MKPTDALRVMAASDDTVNRVTVALVYEAVRGSQAFIEAGFSNVQRQLDGLAPLQAMIASEHERVSVLGIEVVAIRARQDRADAEREETARKVEEAREARARVIEEQTGTRADEERSYRRVHIPTIIIAGLGVAAGSAHYWAPLFG